jgi:putative transposase
VPIAVVADGANRHDKRLLGPTLEAVVVKRPQPTAENPQNLLADKGYDFRDSREEVRMKQYVGHIQARGEEITLKHDVPGYRCRRWVVERTHSWLNRCRRLLVRWEKKIENYLAMLHLACARICYKRAGVFG